MIEIQTSRQLHMSFRKLVNLVKNKAKGSEIGANHSAILFFDEIKQRLVRKT